MSTSSDSLRAFVGDYEPLLNVLKSKKLMPDEQAEAVVHALCDIAESIDKVYTHLVPALLANGEAEVDVFKDRLWDLREEFRHIDYHLHDGKLTEL